ncbi:hypothetical protein ACE193_15370 [Bernardetia sp. OM2101]|uniref:hypothetical protein n=1 Tax=Bernardetia sp. OM2101 TaxID=3344876 RepID=UPI0035CEF543
MVGYILFAITLLTCLPIIIIGFFENKKLKGINDFLDRENEGLHGNLKTQYYLEGCERDGITPRIQEPKQIEKL